MTHAIRLGDGTIPSWRFPSEDAAQRKIDDAFRMHHRSWNDPRWTGAQVIPEPSVLGSERDHRVHNHGPHRGRGLDCPERFTADGRLRGACLPDNSEQDCG